MLKNMVKTLKGHSSNFMSHLNPIASKAEEHVLSSKNSLAGKEFPNDNSQEFNSLYNQISKILDNKETQKIANSNFNHLSKKIIDTITEILMPLARLPKEKEISQTLLMKAVSFGEKKNTGTQKIKSKPKLEQKFFVAENTSIRTSSLNIASANAEPDLSMLTSTIKELKNECVREQFCLKDSAEFGKIQEFTLGQNMPYREGLFIEYKNYKFRTDQENQELLEAKASEILLETMVGFLNGGGGRVFIGVKDHNLEITGQAIGAEDFEKIRNFIENMSNKIVPQPKVGDITVQRLNLKSTMPQGSQLTLLKIIVKKSSSKNIHSILNKENLKRRSDCGNDTLSFRNLINFYEEMKKKAQSETSEDVENYNRRYYPECY